MFRHFFISLCLLAFNSLHAQYPNRFTIGKEELEGAHVYNIFQASDGVYWIATSQGLYKYDSYDFKKLPSKGMVVESYFSIKENYTGQVFCHNLSGQIAVVNQDTVDLFFEIPDSLKNAYMFYDFDKENNLVIGSKALFKVKGNEVSDICVDLKFPASFTDNVRMPNGDLIVIGNFNNKITITPDEYTISKIVRSRFPREQVTPVLFENELLFIGKSNGEIVSGKQNKNWKTKEKGSTYLFNNNEVFELGLVTGLGIIGDEKKLIDDEFVSYVFRDKEGNVLAGTFGKGIMVVPNTKILTWNNLGKRSPFRIETISDTSVLVLCDDKSIWEITEKGETKIIEEVTSSITLFAIPNSNWILIHESSNAKLFNLKTKEKIVLHIGCPKSFKQISNNLFLCASELGMIELKLTLNQGKLEVEDKHVYGVYSRSYSGFFNKENNYLYAGTRYGLKVGDNDTLIEIKIDGQRISTKDAIYFNNQVLLGTGAHGILVLEDDKVVKRINESSGLSNNWVRNFQPYGNKLMCLTGHGIDLLNKDHEVVWSINEINGLASKGYLDAAFTKNKSWFLGADYVEWSDLEEYLQPVQYPTLSVNYYGIDNETIDTSTHEFSFDQSGLKIEFSAPSIKHKKFIQYEYRMIGLDSAWRKKTDYYDRIVEYEFLPEGHYRFEARLKINSYQSDVQAFSFKIFPPFWRTWWFYIGIALSIVVLMWLVFRFQLGRQRKIARIERDAVASKLKAVQSQMNPHFIFNSLNSIQDLVLDKEGQNAYIYLNKFSFLMRSVLEFSQKEFIHIDNELALLEVYLDLEKLRFEEDFNYTLECNVEEVQVPPMLIQPFVENAIKHGLLHKEGQRDLKISIDLKDEVLWCRIEDNGVGRKRAEEIKKRKGGDHKSFSVAATMDRLDVLKSVFDQEFFIEYEDLENEKGTIVHIQMPFRRKY